MEEEVDVLLVFVAGNEAGMFVKKGLNPSLLLFFLLPSAVASEELFLLLLSLFMC